MGFLIRQIQKMKLQCKIIPRTFKYHFHGAIQVQRTETNCFFTDWPFRNNDFSRRVSLKWTYYITIIEIFLAQKKNLYHPQSISMDRWFMPKYTLQNCKCKLLVSIHWPFENNSTALHILPSLTNSLKM